MRFLACEQLAPPSQVLEPYLGAHGTVHTFADSFRFGTWALAHDEVAPVAGLALLAVGDRRAASRVRNQLLERWSAEHGWESFWWRCRAYGTAQALEFLTESGGVPSAVARVERARSRAPNEPMTTVGLSQELAVAVTLGCAVTVSRTAISLLECAAPDGGFEPSPDLLVPDQTDATRKAAAADDLRHFGSALALVALVRALHWFG
jgi:hypothetical protein